MPHRERSWKMKSKNQGYIFSNWTTQDGEIPAQASEWHLNFCICKLHEILSNPKSESAWKATALLLSRYIGWNRQVIWSGEPMRDVNTVGCLGLCSSIHCKNQETCVGARFEEENGEVALKTQPRKGSSGPSDGRNTLILFSPHNGGGWACQGSSLHGSKVVGDGAGSPYFS